MKQPFLAILALLFLSSPTLLQGPDSSITTVKYVLKMNDGRTETLTFFNLGRDAHSQEVSQVYKKLELECDWILQQQFNAANKSFSRTHPNVSFLNEIDSVKRNGKLVGRTTEMYVKWFFINETKFTKDTLHINDYWLKNWWFGGVPKKP